MRILDVRGKSTSHIYRLASQYPAEYYRSMGSEHVHRETTEADIREFREHAEKEGAVAIFISNYGQTAYIPISPIERLPQTKEGVKHFWVEENPGGTWTIVEAFPEGTVRSPFDTKAEAIKREYDIAQYYEWSLKQVPSPQEKFPKQHEVLSGLYPYDIIEYHSDGDLTIQSYEPLPRPKPGFKKGYIFVVTTDGKIFKQEHLAQTVSNAYYWTAVNKGTGEITESTMSYTSSGRALRGGRAFASRHWKGEEALVEVWRQPYRYSENLRIEPVATEKLTILPQVPDEGLPVTPEEQRQYGRYQRPLPDDAY